VTWPLGYVYWSDVGRQTISRSRCVPGLTCDSEEQLVTDLLDTVDGLAVDEVSQVIYWTDAGRQLIEAMTLPAGPRTVLVWNQLDSPRAIALHYDSGYDNNKWSKKFDKRPHRLAVTPGGANKFVRS